jgi:hypothetical protein
MIEKYREIRFQGRTKKRLNVLFDIIKEYEDMEVRITLRQLYYQLVSREIIPNTFKEYKRLCGLATDARYCGLIDWRSIEDRGRPHHAPSEFEDLKELFGAVLKSYKLPRWEGQKYYIEVCCEKDALTSVIHPICDDLHVRLNVNKGFDSASCAYDTAQRFIKNGQGRKSILLYLGDHDPSGIYMTRDVSSRLGEFGACVDVRRVALTMDQVLKYSLPPNLAKKTDSRTAKYIQEHGSMSWEVDALPPEVLSKLLESTILEYLDRPLMDSVMEREEKDKDKLKTLFASGEH